MRNAYLTVAEADAYHEARPSKAKWQAAGDGKAGLLVAASDYLDAMFGLPPDLVALMRGSGEIPPAVQKAGGAKEPDQRRYDGILRRQVGTCGTACLCPAVVEAACRTFHPQCAG